MVIKEYYVDIGMFDFVSILGLVILNIKIGFYICK